MFRVIHDLGRGGDEGDWEAIFEHLRDILSDWDRSTCRELVTGNTDDLLPKISPEFRSNEVQTALILCTCAAWLHSNKDRKSINVVV